MPEAGHSCSGWRTGFLKNVGGPDHKGFYELEGLWNGDVRALARRGAVAGLWNGDGAALCDDEIVEKCEMPYL